MTTTATDNLPPHYIEVLERLLYLCISSPSAVVAGGWVRDLFNSDEPVDVDLFVGSGEDFESALTAFISDTSLTVTPIEPVFNGGGVQTSAHDCVERVFVVSGLCKWPVQLIETERDPIKQVSSFDAPCNMVYIPLHSEHPFDVQSLHVHAFEHAACRIWDENPLARESGLTLNKRAEKFEARGYRIHRFERPVKPPDLDSVDLLTALDALDSA